MATVTQAIQAFLTARRPQHNGPDLTDRWTTSLETQINVSAGKGEPVDGKRSTWTDGVREWHHIRMPKHADTEPVFNDYEMRFSLSEHAEAIGCTGWDFQQRISRWCGFDFDAISGHAAGVGISKEQLEAVRQAAMAVPWVEVRNSTGGNGLHFYVYFDDVPTANHTEHAALARAVLSLLSTEANFDFASQIDACGGNMWIWHRKMSVHNEGLKLLKPALQSLSEKDIPGNWRDHAEVVTRQRKKMRVRGITSEEDFETLATARKFIPLDAKHKAIITKLGELGVSTVWISDYHLLQTHTLGLSKLANDPDLRAELGIVGFFETISSGTTDVNCFLFPLPEGGWKACRFTLGLKEADSWNQAPATWTWCYFNRLPDLKSASLAMGGVELDKKKGFQFTQACDAMRAVAALGELIQIPISMTSRQTILRANDDGRLVIDLKHMDGDSPPGKGWFVKRGWWSKVCGVQTETSEANEDHDHLVRVVVTPSGQSAGTYISSASGSWDAHNTGMTKMYLQSMGYNSRDAEVMIGAAIHRRWERVSLPFQSEYPGGRKWNLGAPQLAYRPAERGENLQHPHWDKVLTHTGQTLTPALRELQWAQHANILSGGDYLRAWFACIIREPFQPLPFLFLHGPEKSAKTTLWEAFELLVTSGVVKADKVLSGSNEFSGELLGAILCVIEERNVASTEGAAARLRDYITATKLSIRMMRKDVFEIPNTTHWMLTTNDLKVMKILPGDTRVTGWYVPPLPPGSEIPKAMLMDLLKSEAPAFLRTLLDMPLPTPTSRLRIPVVETEHKKHIATLHNTPVEKFIADCCFEIAGALMPVSEFVSRFQAWLPESDREKWGKMKTLEAVPPQFPKGNHTGNVRYIGNLSFNSTPSESPVRWISVQERLVRSA